MEKLDERIYATMSAVFGVPTAQLNEDSSVDTVDAWDSIKHLELVIALEQGFSVEFADDEIAELVSFKLIRNIVGEKQ